MAAVVRFFIFFEFTKIYPHLRNSLLIVIYYEFVHWKPELDHH